MTILVAGASGATGRLVTDATKRLCNAIKSNKSEKLTRYVLMNTTANSNRDQNEPGSLAERGVIGLLRQLLPPQVDNEKAADYLRIQIGQEDRDIEWVAVRPDGCNLQYRIGCICYYFNSNCWICP